MTAAVASPAPALIHQEDDIQSVDIVRDAPSTYGTDRVARAEFIVDAVLFDMDGTLVDSIQAVESAWGSVAEELGKDRDEVIEQTHGRRAIDNLKDLKPQLRKLSNVEMDPHVEEFETRILTQADSFNEEVRSRRASAASSLRSSRANSRAASRKSSLAAAFAEKMSMGSVNGPEVNRKLERANSATSHDSGVAGIGDRPSPRGSNAGLKLNHLSGLSGLRTMTPTSQPLPRTSQYAVADESAFDDDDDEDEADIDESKIEVDTSDLVDKSVKILPGVRDLINSLPKGRYAVATSGAKTYAYGAMSRVGIVPPEVTITADDPRLEKGKPHPDPFILAAECLGYDPANCLVVEDSPSGIRAGVASKAKTIAVCTSHPVEKISNSGAHYIVPTLAVVTATQLPDGRLKIVIDEHNAPTRGLVHS